MPYRFLEGVTFADVAFEATGRTLPRLFEESAMAVTATMVADPKKIRPKVLRKVELEAANPESLLHDFLEELVFLKDAQLLVFGSTKVSIAKAGGKLLLKAVLKGEKIDPDRHQMLVDVKAVTWHEFSLKSRPGGGFAARAVLDV